MKRIHFLVLALGAIAAFASFQGTGSIGRTDSLLNATADEVLARLGPPASLGPSGSGFTIWVWPDREGEKRSVTLYGDRVVSWAPEELGSDAAAVELPDGAPYIGQRVEDLLGVLGRPDRTLGVPVPSFLPGPPRPPERIPTLVFGDAWVGMHGGRVMRVGPEPSIEINGPR